MQRLTVISLQSFREKIRTNPFAENSVCESFEFHIGAVVKVGLDVPQWAASNSGYHVVGAQRFDPIPIDGSGRLAKQSLSRVSEPASRKRLGRPGYE